MSASRRVAGPLLALAVIALCTACSGTPRPAGVDASGGAPAGAGGSSAPAVDACAVVPATELAAVAGTTPHAGVPSKGKIDGGQCTWKFSDTHTALVQVTRAPDRYLPASVYPKPKGATAVGGVDRGWANAASHTIIVVKHGTGVLFTDIGFGVSGQGGQSAYDALAKAIAAKL